MSDRAPAAALAAAFLAGPWTAQTMAARGREALGLRRAAWVAKSAASVLEEFPTPPVDAPRRLVEHVVTGTAFTRAAHLARTRDRPLRVAHLATGTALMGRTTHDVPRFDGIADLAAFLGLDAGEVDWFADVRGWQRRAGGTALHHYRSWWVAKRGVPRLLEAPRPRLRELQRRLLRGVLDVVPTHPAAHGFVAGRSAVTGATRHVAAALVVRLDLEAFFAGVDAARVYRGFRSLGYPEPVAHVLTGLTTQRTPLAVLRAMPPGGGPDDRFRLRQWLSTSHLPQGAPTSPALANLCVRTLDRRLAGIAAAQGATFTRYADDLTFSGGGDLPVARLVRLVAAVVAEEGFALNPAKTLVRGRGARQVVTGVVVNDRPNPARDEFDRLKAVLHNCVVHGPASQNRDGHPDLRAHLAGRIGWVAALNPEKAQRLRSTFEQIAW